MNLIVSIHPKYAQLLYAGLKRLEYRRKLWKESHRVENIFLYETLPVQLITGVITSFVQIRDIKLSGLWAYDTDHDPGVTFAEFDKYFKGLERGNAIKPLNIIHFETPINPWVAYLGWTAPQWFRKFPYKVEV